MGIIQEDLCTGCLACAENCPAGALQVQVRGERVHIYHNPSRCARCGLCWRNCPEGAISLEELLGGRWEEVFSVGVLRCERCGEVVCSEREAKRVKELTGGRVLCERCRRLSSSEKWMRWFRR
ncbi:MAG: hypothetical protein DRG36_05685 [Deltaproteobacteria bacterium]|nr:MAG: hypothetical protein DRG36_05685 [Deltaproteobacteria bacterium]RLA98697.1 MAG: hypothetical protein DRG32_00755 [Deltaproteobacteria bacterium]